MLEMRFFIGFVYEQRKERSLERSVKFGFEIISINIFGFFFFSKASFTREFFLIFLFRDCEP